MKAATATGLQTKEFSEATNETSLLAPPFQLYPQPIPFRMSLQIQQPTHYMHPTNDSLLCHNVEPQL